jgi:retron-type reverse transcriptase
MTRYGGLFERICSFENLVAAAYRARQGKRSRPDVAAFHYGLEANLSSLGAELRSNTYCPGGYRVFRIREPKLRQISAAPYRDRVVHHAICQVIEPIFEPTFIFDCYANRPRKGAHRALDRCTFFARRYAYALKCDIEKYFPSIDHEILLSLLARKIKCPKTLRLLRLLVASSNPQEEVIRYYPGDSLFTPFERRRGIPIGNLTSQFFANVYLSGFDHFLKQALRCTAYLRFADDFLIFDDSRTRLRDLLAQIQAYLAGLRLNMHPGKCQVIPTRCGIPFLGWQVFRDHRRIRRSTGVRFQRRVRLLAAAFADGTVTRSHVRASLMSWIGHLGHGDTWGLRRKLLNAVSFARTTSTSDFPATADPTRTGQ